MFRKYNDRRSHTSHDILEEEILDHEDTPMKHDKMSCDMRFPTMWYVRPAKAQTSLRIGAV